MTRREMERKRESGKKSKKETRNREREKGKIYKGGIKDTVEGNEDGNSP